MLWKKHVFAYKLLAGLHFAELGLYGSESPHEARMRELTMEAFGIPSEYHVHCEELYTLYLEGEEQRLGEITQHDTSSPNSAYMRASAFCNFFDRALADAGAVFAGAAKNTLFLRALVDYGPYYDLASDAILREVVVLYREGRGAYERSVPSHSGWGSEAIPSGTLITADVEVEILGHARRIVDRALSAGLGVEDDFEIDPRVAASFQLFKHYFVFIVGVHGFRALAGMEHAELARRQVKRVISIDRYVLASLDALAEGRSLPEPPSSGLRKQVRAVLHRFGLFLPVVLDAWSDGHLDPEERVLSQYGAYHLLGISDVIAARYLRDRQNLEQIRLAMSALPDDPEAGESA
ncbi:MAG: hypothetical protein KC609_15890 [Myxococcales bacterium]|nr:hypothetical protein [Myxococcales bacterium]